MSTLNCTGTHGLNTYIIPVVMQMKTSVLPRNAELIVHPWKQDYCKLVCVCAYACVCGCVCVCVCVCVAHACVRVCVVHVCVCMHMYVCTCSLSWVLVTHLE